MSALLFQPGRGQPLGTLALRKARHMGVRRADTPRGGPNAPARFAGRWCPTGSPSANPLSHPRGGRRRGLWAAGGGGSVGSTRREGGAMNDSGPHHFVTHPGGSGWWSLSTLKTPMGHFSKTNPPFLGGGLVTPPPSHWHPNLSSTIFGIFRQ